MKLPLKIILAKCVQQQTFPAKKIPPLSKMDMGEK
jgi:hypothetical protein